MWSVERTGGESGRERWGVAEEGVSPLPERSTVLFRAVASPPGFVRGRMGTLLAVRSARADWEHAGSVPHGLLQVQVSKHRHAWGEKLMTNQVLIRDITQLASGSHVPWPLSKQGKKPNHRAA